MKTKKCQFCGHRRANQQEWKTEEEKKYCLTCTSFMKFARTLVEALQIVADDKKIGKKVKITLEDIAI